jgi:hypothetical protein
MKKSKIVLGLLLCLGITTIQSQKKIDCDVNFKNALFYLKGDENFKRDTLKSIKYLKPCLKVGDANAQLLMARIYLSKNDEKSDKKAFKLLKKAAHQQNKYAAGDLGILYKYGRGCTLNINKAKKWFKKGAELGNQSATYSLGYLYFKGFGNLTQDYVKAIKWFKKSTHPMAKYWLGVCYYYGYGLPKNLAKANELLGANFNDDNLSKKIEDSKDSDTAVLKKIKESSDDFELPKTIHKNEFYGTWKGTLFQLDWSNTYIEQKIPLNIEFIYDSENHNATYAITVAEQVISGNLIKANNSIYFEDLSVALPHASFHKKIPTKLLHQFLSSELALKEVDGINYLTGNIENHIGKWNESGAPLQFVLQKKETFSNSDKELTDEALKALSAQKNNFIKLYPNPFREDLIISYTLEKASNIQIKVSDIKGLKTFVVEKGVSQKPGNHRYFFNGTQLLKGLYVVTVITDSGKKTRIIVKK